MEFWRGAVGQGSGVIDHDSALGHGRERAPSLFRYHSRKSLSLPTQAMMKVLALDRRFASARFTADWAINASFHLGGGAGGWM